MPHFTKNTVRIMQSEMYGDDAIPTCATVAHVLEARGNTPRSLEYVDLAMELDERGYICAVLFRGHILFHVTIADPAHCEHDHNPDHFLHLHDVLALQSLMPKRSGSIAA